MNFPEIYSATGMMELIQKNGFLPLLDSGIEGFSAEDIVAEDCGYVSLPEGGWDQFVKENAPIQWYFSIDTIVHSFHVCISFSHLLNLSLSCLLSLYVCHWQHGAFLPIPFGRAFHGRVQQ